MRKLLALIGAASLMACSAQSETPAFPYFEKEGGRVRDGADIVAPAVEAQLTAKLDNAEAEFGPQLAIVTVDSLHGYAIEDFSILYARAWGLGDKDRNNGLLILVAPNERKVRIEVGKGIEDSFTDLFCKDVIDHAMIPAFERGDYDAGIVTGADALVERMRQRSTIPANDDMQFEEQEAA